MRDHLVVMTSETISKTIDALFVIEGVLEARGENANVEAIKKLRKKLEAEYEDMDLRDEFEGSVLKELAKE